MEHRIPPPHPGETIQEDYLEPLGMSVNQLAKALGITAARINDVAWQRLPRIHREALRNRRAIRGEWR